MQGLLLTRPALYLVPAGGDVVGTLPESLRANPWRPDVFSRLMLRRHSLLEILAGSSILSSGLATAEAGQEERLIRSLQETREKALASRRRIDAAWSGRRSCVTIGGDGHLYKVKGVSFGNRPAYEIHSDGETFAEYVHGGQFLRNVRSEKDATSLVNGILASEGLAPASEFVGYYRYSTKARGRRLAASIFRVEGDTRLDEMLFALARVGRLVTHDHEKLQRAPFYELNEELHRFYRTAGIAVGSMLGALHRNGVTWSDNAARSNAHLGNIIVYERDGSWRFGITDFDAAGTRRDLKGPAFGRQAESEIVDVMNHIQDPIVVSARENWYCEDEQTISGIRRTFFNDGFVDGYRNRADESSFSSPLLMSIVSSMKALTQPDDVYTRPSSTSL